MSFKLQKNSTIPIGSQIKEHIRMLVYFGVYKPGDKIPSINIIAREAGVNKNTVVSALKELENEGCIESFRGKGVYISNTAAVKAFESTFLKSIDEVISDSKKNDLGINELIGIISSRFSYVPYKKTKKAIFITNINREIGEINIKKLQERIPGIEFKAVISGKRPSPEKLGEAFKDASLIIAPDSAYEIFKDFLPKDVPVLRSEAELGKFAVLKRGIEKKSRIGIIGSTEKNARIIADCFYRAGFFKAKLVFGFNDMDRYKKELKDVEILVVCKSVADDLEGIRLKDKEIYYFSDYINEASLEKIKVLLEEPA